MLSWANWSQSHGYTSRINAGVVCEKICGKTRKSQRGAWHRQLEWVHRSYVYLTAKLFEKTYKNYDFPMQIHTKPTQDQQSFWTTRSESHWRRWRHGKAKEYTITTYYARPGRSPFITSELPLKALCSLRPATMVSLHNYDFFGLLRRQRCC